MNSKVESYDVIRRPIITEKATNASESGPLFLKLQWCN